MPESQAPGDPRVTGNLKIDPSAIPAKVNLLALTSELAHRLHNSLEAKALRDQELFSHDTVRRLAAMMRPEIEAMVEQAITEHYRNAVARER